MSRTVAYRLEPIPEQVPGGLSTAAIMTCIATGEILSGSGGGGLHLAPAVVEALRSDGTPKVIMDASEHEGLVALARAAAEGFDVKVQAEAIVASMGDATA